MKKNWMFILVLVLTLCLAACGPKETPKETATEPVVESTPEATLPEGVYDVGNYTVAIPEGWHALNLDNDGCNLYIYKDAETEEDFMRSVGLRITGDPLGVVLPIKEDFPDAKDLDTSVLNGKPEGFTWTGWSAQPMFLFEYLTGHSDHGHIGVVLQGNTMENEDTLTFSDPIVQEILSSIQFH